MLVLRNFYWKEPVWNSVRHCTSKSRFLILFLSCYIDFFFFDISLTNKNIIFSFAYLLSCKKCVYSLWANAEDIIFYGNYTNNNETKTGVLTKLTFAKLYRQIETFFAKIFFSKVRKLGETCTYKVFR